MERHATTPPMMFDTVHCTRLRSSTHPRGSLPDLGRAREKLTGIAVRPIEREAHTVLETIRLRDEARRREILERPGCSPCDRPAMDPIYFQTYQYYQARQKEVSDPTTLIVVDEADRLQMNSLEQVRSVFDSGDMGMILIGMPGIEKRIARFPQLYSRIGFVHEFRPLGATEVQELLERCWTPPASPYLDTGFFPRSSSAPGSNDRRQLGDFFTRLLTLGRTRPRCQRRPGHLGRNRRGSSRQPCHRPDIRLGTLRQIIPQELRQIIPHTTD